MAPKLKNLAIALKDTKTRTLLIVVGIIVLIGIAIGYFGLRRAERAGAPVGAAVLEAPRIKSIPGGGPPPSREYVKTQEQENLLRAQQAASQGTSAIPTITRTTYTGPSEFQVPAIPGSNTPGGASSSPDCSPEALQRARQAGVKVEELRCKGCSADQLRAAGYTAGDLLNAGFSADQLKAAGFQATDLRDAGYTAAEMAKAGYSQADLAVAGLTAQQLAASQLGTATAALPKDCSVAALKQARAQGISASDLRKMGCGAAALRAAGYTAGELRQAGFTAKELRDAGFSAAELRDAGFSAQELADAGFSADDLKAAGFSNGDLVRAGLTPITNTAVVAVTPTSTPTSTPNYTTPSVPMNAVVIPQGSGEDPAILALEKLQKRQADQLSLQDRQDRITQLQQTMSGQASDLFATWSPPPKQVYLQGEPPDTGSGANGNGAQGKSGAGGQGQLAGQPQPPLIKAGSIMFAVLDTSLNSDEPSPILATVVTGPYKGSKLIGSFQRVDQKVIVNFTSMNVPSLVQSIGINAVAIDPNTARTALADNVDNHYLLRYGSLFASAFVSGYAQATEQSGSTTTISTAGISQTGPNLSAGEKAIVGLGQVGNQVSTSLGSLFTKPPTVTVDAGGGIGILFMTDVSIASPAINPMQSYSSPLGSSLTSTSSPPVPAPPSNSTSGAVLPAISATQPQPSNLVTSATTPPSS